MRFAHLKTHHHCKRLIIVGKTGLGKSWLACALGHKASSTRERKRTRHAYTSNARSSHGARAHRNGEGS
jgi:DNA replication protein DnaC